MKLDTTGLESHALFGGKDELDRGLPTAPSFELPSIADFDGFQKEAVQMVKAKFSPSFPSISSIRTIHLSMANKEGDVPSLLSTSPSSPAGCCMCGDYGLPSELFRCRRCLFRSQHRYCSNLYPKAESYRFCNWCLKQGQKMEGITRNSSLSSSNSDHVNTRDDGDRRKNKRSGTGNHQVGLKIQRSTSQLQLHSPTKKLKFSDQQPLGQKKVISVSSSSNGRKVSLDLRRTKSEDMSNARMVKQEFKGKVRRYKLLEEVSIR